MNNDKLRELRAVIDHMNHALESVDDSECDKCIALAIIDAELAKQEDVCVWGHSWSGSAYYSPHPAPAFVRVYGSTPLTCPDCGKRVEVR